MAVKGYSIEPKTVPLVETEYRKICTQIPVPESLPLLHRLRAVEAYSLHWQFPVFWDRAEGFNVYDKYGNKWIDMSSGIAVASAGHARQEIIDAVTAQANKKLLYNFTFPSEIRLEFLEALVDFASDVAPYLTKAFLMSAGSEACENILKLARKYQQVTHGPGKNTIVSFEGAFHGRTLGSQMMGGLPDLKDWIVHPDPEIVQVPFPDGFFNEDTSFESFERSLEAQGVKPESVAAVVVEGFQGANVHFMPVPYAQALRKWCTDYDALLVFDEVQSGFGRTGKKFGFLHYGVEADVISLGKAITGSLPLSATLARPEIMDVFHPGSMTSTHTGNPLCCAAGIANLKLFEEERFVEQAAKLGEVFQPGLRAIAEKYATVGVATGMGAIAGLQLVEPGTKTPNKQRAYDVNQRLCEKGLMMFAPVGKACTKFAPPFVIPEAAVREALEVIDAAIGEIVAEQKLS